MATMITTPSHLTFIHIPKTGGNSVTDWLRDNFNIQVTKRRQHATISEARDRLGNLGTTFCIVRNPWDYAVSWYTFKLYLARTYIKNIKENPHMSSNRKDKWNLELQQKRLARLEQGFTPWLEQTTRPQQVHWARGCDIILKLENINDDFKIIQDRLNCYIPLPIKNKTPNRTEYKDYYTDQTIELVRKKFKDDIEAFDYNF